MNQEVIETGKNYRNIYLTIFWKSVGVLQEHVSICLQSDNLPCDGPEEPFNLCSCFKVNDTQAETIESLFPYLLCIMPRFKHSGLTEIIPEIIDLLYKFMIISPISSSISQSGSVAVSSTSKTRTE